MSIWIALSLCFTLFGLFRDSENLADLVCIAVKSSFCVEAGVAFGCLRDYWCVVSVTVTIIIKALNLSVDANTCIAGITF